MESTTPKKKLKNNHFPHIGEMIEYKTREKVVRTSEVASRIGVSPIGYTRYFERESLQFSTIWKICIALKYNFLADLMDYLPEDVLHNSQSSYKETIEAQAAEIADLKKEIAIYKGILMK